VVFVGVNSPARWLAPEWREEAEAWIAAHVEVTGEIDQFKAEAWSTVMRVPTADGTVYFKANAPEHLYEVPLLDVLTARVPSRVPDVIATDAERGWLLLADAGRRLRELESEPGQLERWKDALRLYADVQRAVADDSESLVAAGVPDRRLHVLVDAYAELLHDSAAVRPDHEEALTEEELAAARAQLDDLRVDAQRLVELGLPETVQHDDLHDGNVFVGTDGMRIIDWGDTCISHPFLSFAITAAVVRHRLPGEDVHEVWRAYLEPWGGGFEETLEPALRLGFACGALKWNDVVSAMEPVTRAPFEDAVPRQIRRVLGRL
jgi:aminoglycoside/choline kinase family phosphotransferase